VDYDIALNQAVHTKSPQVARVLSISSNQISSTSSNNLEITSGESYVVDHSISVDSFTMEPNSTITFNFNSDEITVNGHLILNGNLIVNLGLDDSSITNGTIIQLFNLTSNSTTIGHFNSL